MADGFSDPRPDSRAGIVGSNQDPCVFSRPWPPFHAFCRLDGAHLTDERIRAGQTLIGESLASVVERGDVILYGKTDPPSASKIKRVWVDTVMVVADTLELPVIPRGSAFDLAADAHLPTAPSDAYNFNLRDAEPTGMHATTRRRPHKIIRGLVEPTRAAVAALATSFVPLADHDGQWEVCGVEALHLKDSWADLVTFFQRDVYGVLPGGGKPKGGWISKFESFDLAQRLVAAIVARSGGHQDRRGTVAVPPLLPLGPSTIRRWDPRREEVLTESPPRADRQRNGRFPPP